MDRTALVYIVAGILVLILGPFSKLIALGLIAYGAYILYEDYKKESDSSKKDDEEEPSHTQHEDSTDPEDDYSKMHF